MQTPQERLEILVAERLEHLADRVEWLLSIGDEETAVVLKTEGLMLAEAYDREDPFFAIDTAALFQ